MTEIHLTDPGESYTVPAHVRDLSPEVLDGQGRMRILPATYWATTTVDERGKFGFLNGIYSFPTEELVEYLRTAIGDRSAIEIGSGNGVLAETLGITATDNFMQRRQPYNQHYLLTGQPIVQYGSNVLDFDARQAVRRFRPQVVIACWVTHKYERQRHHAGGHVVGVNELDLLENCEQLIFVGNKKIHASKKIWTLPHEIEYPDWLYSRSMTGSPEFIATWAGSKPPRKVT